LVIYFSRGVEWLLECSASMHSMLMLNMSYHFLVLKSFKGMVEAQSFYKAIS
jgi:hypothetical protein